MEGVGRAVPSLEGEREPYSGCHAGASLKQADTRGRLRKRRLGVLNAGRNPGLARPNLPLQMCPRPGGTEGLARGHSAGRVLFPLHPAADKTVAPGPWACVGRAGHGAPVQDSLQTWSHCGLQSQRPPCYPASCGIP